MDVVMDRTPSGQPVCVLLPGDYHASRGAPLVLYHHGAGENELALVADVKKAETVQALIDAGYILAGCYAAGDNWGSAASLDAYRDLYEYVQVDWHVTSVVAWSQSMGGLSGLLSVAEGSIPYRAWLGTFPVCSLAAMWGRGDVYAASLLRAYGIAEDGSDYDEMTAGHDPLMLPADRFRGVAVRLYASPSDTTVLAWRHSTAFQGHVRGQGECGLVVCRGEHGDRSHFSPGDYVRFFDRATQGDRASNPGREEALCLR